jgi:hypothetical protein
MFGLFVTVVLLLMSFANGVVAQSDELPPGATVLDSDLIWDVVDPYCFAMSRDDKKIAYISRGAIWVCNVDAGPPTKLAELPYTITAILADPANNKERQEAAASPRNSHHNYFLGPPHRDRHYVFGLVWTPDQKGIVYTMRRRLRDDSPVSTYYVMYASLSGEVDQIVAIEGNFGTPSEYTTKIHVTKDRKFVIASSYHPLIWDVEEDKPRATPYDLLVPSSTSGRFLGIEIDTRQLVLVDEQFQIAKRYEVTFPVDKAVDLTWSDNERFAVCRIRDDYGSYKATAFRIDLETGKQVGLSKANMQDDFVFTGKEGELLHLRIAAANVWGFTDGELGTCVTTVDKDGSKKDIFITKQIRKSRTGRSYTFPPLIATDDGSHIAVPIPRPEDQAAGAHYHLVDREGKAKPFVPTGDDNYLTPYYPITFADGGKRLIARLGSSLFSIPVSKVADDCEASDE